VWFKSKQYIEDSNYFKKMCELICLLNSEDIYDWSLGRIIDWKYGLWNEIKQDTFFFEKTTMLWINYLDELAGFVLSENGSNEVQYVLNKKYSFLYESMISFSKEKYETIETVCNITDTAKVDYLLKHGFVDIGECETTFVYDSKDIVFNTKSLPDGYNIQAMDTYKNYINQIDLKRNAFRNNRKLLPKEYYAYEYVKSSPLYDASMDFVIINDLQEAVAGCEGFIDYQNSIMEVERVCTHTDYRKRGFAKTIIGECIKHGIERGVKKIHITGWDDTTKNLYSSYGNNLQISKHKFVYKKKHLNRVAGGI